MKFSYIKLLIMTAIFPMANICDSLAQMSDLKAGNGVVKIASSRIIHRFFDTSPISPSGKYMALFRMPYEDHTPAPGDAGEVVLVDLQSGVERVVTTSRGWEMQLGAQVQWGASDQELYFNDVDISSWKAFAVKLNPLTGVSRRLDGTVFMVSRDGKKLASHNLIKSRYAQIGYGVIIPKELAARNVGIPNDDGVFITDTDSGKSKLLVSIQDIYDRSVPSIAISNPQDFEYYCFQVKWNPQGTRLLTTVQWSPVGGGARKRAVITMKADGSDLKTAVTPDQWAKGGHHVNWMPDGDHISMNLELGGKPGLELITARYDGTDLKTVFQPGSGHPSYHPKGLPLIVTDAYPGEMVTAGDGTVPIRLLNTETGIEEKLAGIFLSKAEGEFRIDAHPAWDNTGKYVVFNGLSDGTRSVFMASVDGSEPTPLYPWKVIGQLKTRDAKQIGKSSWSIGGETLDRDYTDYQSYKTYLGPLGAKRIRLQGGWSKCEKIKGVYDFKWLDAVIPDAASRGVFPWVELSYGNPIYEGGGDARLAGHIPTSPEALQAWDNWVRAIVTRYKDQVPEWEIWNEPDLNPTHTGREIGAFYLRTARIVKSVQPKAKLIALGMASVTRLDFMKEFMDYLKENDSLQYIDLLTYHGYAYNPDESYPKIEKLRELVWRYKPSIVFMQGENGAPSTPKEVTIGALRDQDWTELTQAKWDLRRMLGDHGRGIATNLFTISDIHYAAGDHMVGVNTKGILKTNSDKTIERPKMAYKAAQHVFSLFDDQLELQPGNPEVNQENLYAFQYKSKKGSNLLTLWSGEARPAENYNARMADITVTGEFKEPVLADLISGKTYAVPKENWSVKDGKTTFKSIAVPDYPVVIAEAALLH
ncbi:GH39 family glycosyl hydrolase [Dyadobacter arcticus]|uniref:Glycosyl hydrolases family 39 N-terminal catalytic domain-containing protein n=1 Tax=Dyadobacter arcticus TaxID=1078754 RepID=A0ABX0UNR7_9BACT|nr:hypothetical protein [Dyadobacter arcticus]NIJ54631.1 hypothetical protein [Dyadobacter arcticus]